MKFVLTYDGPLSANKVRQKWELRKKFHPQLQELWRVHPALVTTEKIGSVPANDRHIILDTYHRSSGSPGTSPVARAGSPAGMPGNPLPVVDQVDLTKPILRGGRQFRPLVSETLALTCGLKVQFLRAEGPGGVYQGGDMDNRLKTLFDALSAPQNAQQVEDDGETDPIFCLLEDDALITSLSVDTRRYLNPPGNANDRHVRLLIEVDVRVSISRTYNHQFLGD